MVFVISPRLSFIEFPLSRMNGADAPAVTVSVEVATVVDAVIPASEKAVIFDASPTENTNDGEKAVELNQIPNESPSHIKGEPELVT